MGVIQTDTGDFVLNVRPSLPDIQEWRFAFNIPQGLTVPDLIELDKQSWWTTKVNKAWNQGGEGSCTGHAQGKGHEIARAAAGLPANFDPSPRYIYNKSRMRMGTLGQDSGATIMDSIMAEVESGVCSRQLMPYTPNAGLTTQPNQAQNAEAAEHQVLKWEMIQQSDAVIGAALALGVPISIGFVVYSNFQPDANGVIPMPAGSMLGGHNVLIIGRDFVRKRYKIFNSWDEPWGVDSGKAFMPFNYILNPNLTFEMKAVNIVEGTPTPPDPIPPEPIPEENDYWTYTKMGFKSGKEWYADIVPPPWVN